MAACEDLPTLLRPIVEVDVARPELLQALGDDLGHLPRS